MTATTLTSVAADRPLSTNWRFVLRLLLPILALPVFAGLALPDYSTTQRLLAWLVFVLGTAPVLRFFERPTPGHVPLIELVGLQYALFFGLPVFYEAQFQVSGSFYVRPASSAITAALVCAALAFAAIYIGQALTRRFVHVRLAIVQFVPSAHRLFVYGLVVTLGAMTLRAFGVGGTALTSGPMEVLLPRSLGLSILASLYYAVELSSMRRLMIAGVFLGYVFSGLVAGSTQLVAEPVIVWALARWVFAGKAPTTMALVLVCVFVVLQPIKGRYRASVASGIRTFTPRQSVELYFSMARSYWSTGREEGSIASETRAAASHRLSLLLSTAHYIQLTPLYVGYHGPRTVLYPTYSWVPRVLWPNKPTAQEANSRLPVEYGIQSPDNVNITMFGVGHVAEVYTALGFAAIVPLFVLLGVLYATPTVVLREGRTVATTALLIWFALNMMKVESTIGNTFGSLLQQLVVQCTLLRMFTKARHPSSP